jgi:hypothetical protein
MRMCKNIKQFGVRNLAGASQIRAKKSVGCKKHLMLLSSELFGTRFAHVVITAGANGLFNIKHKLKSWTR